jgi:hypothetical protein
MIIMKKLNTSTDISTLDSSFRTAIGITPDGAHSFLGPTSLMCKLK